MRIITRVIPQTQIPDINDSGLISIRCPGGIFGMAIAQVTGFILLICPTLFLCMALSQIALPPTEAHTVSMDTTSWPAVILMLIAFIPLHEAVHLLLQPGMGRGDNNLLLFIPSKLLFGVYYEGSMSRTRWLVMRMAPFVLLTLLPVTILALIQNLPFNYFVRTLMEVLMVVNGVGCGGDVVAALIVLFQVPATADIVFQQGKAYWKP
jgi:hypothetical protein